MTKEKMTVHQALAELKTIDNRILKKIDGATFVKANKHSNQKINGRTLAEFTSDMKSDYQSIVDLINRRNALKRAVVLSNASTKVTVSGVEYTVAEAIDMKNNGMNHKEVLLRSINYQNTSTDREVENHSGSYLEKNAEQYILSVIAAQPKDSKMSTDSETMQSLRKAYIENNAYDKIDPLDVTQVMKALEEEVDTFNVNVDAALSVSNAITTIEFEY